MLPKCSGGLLYSQQKAFSPGLGAVCHRIVLHVSCSSSVEEVQPGSVSSSGVVLGSGFVPLLNNRLRPISSLDSAEG